MKNECMNSGTQFRFLLFGIITGSFFLRVLYAGSFELLQEEAYYWNYAQHLDYGYLDHPPMVALLIKLGTAVFGNSEFSIRVGAILCWCIATLFTYLYTRDISNRDTAIQAAAIMSVLPAFFIFGLVMTPDAPLIACWAGVLFYSRRALVDQDEKSWIGVGVLLGLGLFSKYTIALLGIAILVFLILDRPSRRWFLKPHPYCAAALALFIFSPVIIWNYEHDWASFLFQTSDRLSSSSEFSSHELLFSIIILLSPVGFFAAAFFMTCRKTFIDSMKISKQQYKFAFTATAVPLAVFFVFSLTKEIKLNWTSPVWLAAMPFMALTVSQANSSIKALTQIRFLRGWKITMVSLLLIYGWIFQYYSVGIPGVSYSGEGPLLGWKSFATQIETIVDSIEIEMGERPYVIGMDLYKSASGLAFYRTLQLEKDHSTKAKRPVLETAGRNLFGQNAVMYDYWFSKAQFKGKPLIVVSPNSKELEPWFLFGKRGLVSEVKTLESSKNQQKVAPLYYRLVKVHDLNHTKSLIFNQGMLSKQHDVALN